MRQDSVHMHNPSPIGWPWWHPLIPADQQLRKQWGCNAKVRVRPGRLCTHQMMRTSELLHRQLRIDEEL